MAPQILGKEKFSAKCDIWSLGVTIFEILYGVPPYNAKNPKELLENIRKLPLKFP
jgi:serine/threonine-protein kinase ULK/ATG1